MTEQRASMRMDEAWALRDRAAMPVLAGIRADAEQAPAAISRMLRHVHDHLFDATLTVGSMVRNCGYASRATADAFPRVVGTTAKAYITAQRLTVARTLLEQTPLKVAEIGRLIGIDDATTFSRAVRRRFGASPKALRRAQDVTSSVPASLESGSPRREARESDSLEPGALQGDATSRPWIELLAAWRRLEFRAGRKNPHFSIAESARLRAEAAWAVARGLDSAARRELIVRAALSSPALVEHLAARSRIEGRGDRARGVAMAALAVEAVPAAPNDAWSAEAIAHARVNARAWHVNALRLALDYPEAEAVLARAESLLESSSCPIPLDVQVRLQELGASLYLYWSKPGEAVQYARRALTLAERLGDASTLVRVLLVRAAIDGFSERFGKSLEALKRAQRTVERESVGLDLAFGVASNLCLHFYYSGRVDLALNALPRAQLLASVLPDRLPRAHVTAVEGRLHLESGSYRHAAVRLRAALDDFVAQEAFLYQAFFGLDLCLAYMRLGEAELGIEVARSLLPTLKSMSLDRERSAVIRLIEEGLRQSRLRQSTIQAVRETMNRVSLEPGLRARLSFTNER